MGEVVIYDQHIPPRFHEELRDAGGGVWGDVGETRRGVSFGYHQDGVLHRAFFPQSRHGLGDRGGPLANGAIDAQYILPALVEDGVESNGSLARLAVAENQLALAASHGNE